MAILNFSDVLKKVGLDLNDVTLIRHALSDQCFRDCYKAGMVHEYTRHQDNRRLLSGCSYWITFISDGGTYARLHSCYHRVGDPVPDTPDVCPAGLPDCEAKKYRGERAFFDLQHVDLLKEYEGKLVIDWGKGRNWNQSATNEKPIVAIESMNQKPFVGFESLILSFDELKEVVENDTDYELWQAAMAAVNAVYLIVDTKTGDRYVGSTYGYDGLLGRWSVYVATGGHGNNKELISHLESADHSCRDLQFSVLQVLSKVLPDSQIIDTETLWKKKLLTYEPFGMNKN